MSATIKNDYGKIVISEKVLASYAARAASETYGIVGLAAQNAKDGLFELLKVENNTKGINIRINGDELDIDVLVIMEYGVRISVVAENIIEKIKYNIEKNTRLKVNNVNIIVQGVRV